MAWTTPPTFVSDAALTAAQLNVLGEDLVYAKGVVDGIAASCFRIGRVTAQSIPNSATTNIIFTAEIFDVGGWWSSGDTATVPASAVPAGYTNVLLSGFALLRFVSNGTGGRICRIAINGTALDSVSTSAIIGETTTVTLPILMSVAAGDALTVEAVQSSGGALNCDVARLALFRVGPIS